MPTDVSELDRHRLSREVFDQFCAGAVDAEAIAAIRAGQYSRRRLLLCALLNIAEDKPDIAGPLNHPEDVWQILTEIDDERPDIVEEILTHPTVGVWANRTLRKTRGARSDLIPLWTDLGYLHCLAAAAAIRSGIPCDLRLPVTHGVVTLPTVGQVRLQGSFPIGFVELAVSATGMVLRAGSAPPISFVPDQESPAFVPSRKHRTVAGHVRLDVEIDDCDPYREFSAPMAPFRLDSIDLSDWCKQITEAWEVLTLWHRPHAVELSAALRTLVPISADGNVTGASSPAAFGSVALAATDSATSLAENLLHEIQHSKLNALFELVRLQEDDSTASWYAPWRDDPRPLAGLLHGIYAFVTAVEFWLVQRDLVPQTEAPLANYAFALRRHQVRETVNTIRSADALTGLGRALVEAVAARLAACETAELPDGLADLVMTMTDDHRMIWRLRHVRPAPEDISDLAMEWVDQRQASAVADVRREVVPDMRGCDPWLRGGLLRMQALDPVGLADAVSRPSALPGGCNVADAAFVGGDNASAEVAYVARIRAVPNDVQAWAGLGLALRARGADREAGVLLDAPETAYSLYNNLLVLGETPHPVRLVTWLGSVLAR